MTRVQRIAARVAIALGLSSGAAAVLVTDILNSEGWRNTAYQDSAGIWTICAGHTGPDVFRGLVLSDAECEAITANDIIAHGRPVLDALVNATEGEKIAWIDFAFNAGVSAFLNSTARRLQNQGRRAESCQQLLRWVYITVGSRKLDCRNPASNCRGLPTRREEQLARCMQSSAVLRYFYIAGGPHVQHPVQHLLADRAAVGGHGGRLLGAAVHQHHRRLGGLVLREGPARHHLGAGLDRVPGRRHRRGMAALALAA